MISWTIDLDAAADTDAERPRDADVCGFPDFDHQAYLLPYFDVGDAVIDPYGGTRFTPADARRLRDHLANLRDHVEAKPDVWTITDTSAPTDRTITLRRETIERVIDATINLCDRAIAAGHGLRFLGD